MALDTEGGPNWVHNYVDAPIIVNSTAGEYYKQAVYYALAHFSKFIIPNSHRIQLLKLSFVHNFECIAFLRPDNASVVIALNMNNEHVVLTINDANEGTFTQSITPHSIFTFIWWNS